MNIFFIYFQIVLNLHCKYVYLAMAKKMISVKIEENLKPVLEKISEIEGRSQGNLVERWIKKDAKRLNITIVKEPTPPKQ